MSRCIVITGTQWGDEGKGKIVDALSAQPVNTLTQGAPKRRHINAGDGVIDAGLPDHQCGFLGNDVALQAG